MNLQQLISDKEKQERFVKFIADFRTSGMIGEVKQFCSDIDYQTSTFWVVMSGKRLVPDVLIYKVCEYFRLDPAYFFGRSKKLTSWSDASKKELDESIAAFRIKIDSDIEELMNRAEKFNRM